MATPPSAFLPLPLTPPQIRTLYRRLLTRLTHPPSGTSTSTTPPPAPPPRDIPIHIAPPLTLTEACQILNITFPKPGPNNRTDLSTVDARYKKLYDKNETEVGGSFYLQSKVVMARDRVVGEVKKREEEVERERELEGGWKPRVFK